MPLQGLCRDSGALVQAVLHELKLDLRASMCRASRKPIKGIYTVKLMLALLLSSLGPAGRWQSCAVMAGEGRAHRTAKQTPPAPAPAPAPAEPLTVGSFL